MIRNKNVVVNIPSDGLEEEVIRTVDADVEVYRQSVKRYISEFLKDTACGKTLSHRRKEPEFRS